MPDTAEEVETAAVYFQQGFSTERRSGLKRENAAAPQSTSWFLPPLPTLRREIRA